MNKWETLKEKVTGMIEAEKMMNNKEAEKAYYHILRTMEVCEEMQA